MEKMGGILPGRRTTWYDDLDRLKISLAEDGAWRHPALEAMRRGEPTARQLRSLLLEYYHFTGTFVGWIALIVARAGDDVRRLLLPNLTDEVTDPTYRQSHRALLEALLTAVGVTSEQLAASRPSSTTVQAAEFFWNLGLRGGVVENLFALGPGTEAISHRFLEPMEQSVRSRFGLRDRDLAYFEVHRSSVEDQHAQAIDDAIISTLESASEKERTTFWDGGFVAARRAVREHGRLFETLPEEVGSWTL